MSTEIRVKRIAWQTRQRIREVYDNNLMLTIDDLCRMFSLNRRTIKAILKETD